MSIILQTKSFPRRLLSHRFVEFSQNVDWKMMVIISLKVRNLGFKIFFQSGFSDGNNCLKWSCSISKLSQAFQSNCDRKHLTMAFDFREPAMISLDAREVFLSHPVCFSKLGLAKRHIKNNASAPENTELRTIRNFS